VATAEGDQYDLWLDGSDERGVSSVPPPPPQTGPVGWQSNRPVATQAAQSNQQQQQFQQPRPARRQHLRPQPPQPQPQPQAQHQAQQQPRPKPDITIEQLVQKAYYPPVATPWTELPKQMPWVLEDPILDGIWRNDDFSVEHPSRWSGQPFGQHPRYPTEREPNT
jgi:hypothetical protein